MATFRIQGKRPAITQTVAMDAAGLAFGIPSAFIVVVADIRIIRDCQSFGQDYQTTQLKFQLAEARLVRWGVAVRIAERDTSSSGSPGLLLEKLVPEEDRKKATEMLQAIRMELESAKKKMGIADLKVDSEPEQSRKVPIFRIWGKHRGSEARVAADQELQTGTLTTLTDDFREITLKHHRQTSTAKKAKWALFVKTS